MFERPTRTLVFGEFPHSQKPTECSSQFTVAVAVIPATVREEDVLRLPAEHRSYSVPQFSAMTAKGQPHVERRLAVGINHASDPKQRAEPWRANTGQFEVLNQIGQNKRPARPMKEDDFRECRLKRQADRSFRPITARVSHQALMAGQPFLCCSGESLWSKHREEM
jgi:hypothetical protein